MDTNSFAYNFNGLSGYLRGFAYKLTRDKTSAEDLFQETAFNAFKNQDKFRPDTNMKAWLSTIMKNSFINSFRKKQRQNQILDHSSDRYLLNSGTKAIDNEGELKVVADELYELVEDLNEGLKQPFLMAFNGYKYEEISEAMDMPMGTVKSRIFLARKELKNRIAEVYN